LSSSDADAPALAAALAKTVASLRLRKVVLHHVGVTSLPVLSALPPSVRDLKFGGGGGDAASLGAALRPALQRFTRLERIEIESSNQGGLVLRELFTPPMMLPHLTELALMECRLGAPGASELAAVLPRMPNLAKLCVWSDDRMGGNGGAGLRDLVNALPATLAELLLNCIGMDDADVEAIAGRIATLPRLRSLDLSGNRIGGGGMEHLARELVKAAPPLEELSLRWNEFDDDFALALKDVIRAMPQLRVLDLEDNGDDGGGAQFGKAARCVLEMAQERWNPELDIRWDPELSISD